MGNVALTWAGEGTQMFIGRDSFGHVVVSGSWPSEDHSWQEWKGVKPSDLLLLSLASCSAYDVVTILAKQRQKISKLYINVDGKQLDKPPYTFTDIHLHYELHGENLDRKKILRAIELSESSYCSVAATIRGVSTISHSFEVGD